MKALCKDSVILYVRKGSDMEKSLLCPEPHYFNQDKDLIYVKVLQVELVKDTYMAEILHMDKVYDFWSEEKRKDKEQ